ncbi:MAG: hypothetical protein JXB10_13015 [Pirellulales bacterium]|nr:hypothetical protein [Pirellulales bacterium]
MGWVLCVSIFLVARAAGVEKLRPGEYYLPSTSQGFLAISQVEVLIEHYDRTELGKLTSDPVMEPFTQDLRRQFENRWSGVHQRLGLTLQDLRDLAGGEVSVALIKPDEDPLKEVNRDADSPIEDNDCSAMALLVDATGKTDVVRKKIEELKKFFKEEGATQQEITVEKTPVLQFTLPIPEAERNASASPFGGSAPPAGQNASDAGESSGPKPKRTLYFLVGDLFGAADDVEVVRGILARIGGREGDALADVPGYQKVVARCRADFDGDPQIRWFMNPVGYASAMRAATPKEKRRKGKSLLEVLRNQGFTGVKGIGGFASFSAEGFDLIHRTAVYAPRPYEKSMKMLDFFNREDFAPQPWVPRDIATYTTFYFDVLNAFDNFDSLFDELYGGGDRGLWQKTLRDLKEDPNGPQIDLREELIKLINQRVTILTDYHTPIELNSERILVALEVSDEKAAARAIDKAMRGDRGTKLQEINGLQIWEIVDEEVDEFMPPPEVDLGNGVPRLTPETPKTKLLAREEGPPPLFPHAAITVTKGHLFIASHPDFLLKILQPRESRELLINDLDYQMVADQIAWLKPEKACLHVYSRTDEEYRPTYELVRQNKMPESENMLARLLNSLFGEGKNDGKRQAKLDGSKLPEYDVVRRYLRPAGMQVTAEKDGWFLKGFTLGKYIGVNVAEAASGEEAQAAEPRPAEEKPTSQVITVAREKAADPETGAGKPGEQTPEDE